MGQHNIDKTRSRRRQTGGRNKNKTVRVFLHHPATTTGTLSDVRVHAGTVDIKGFHDLGRIFTMVRDTSNEIDNGLYETMHGISKPPYKEIVFRLNLGKRSGLPKIKTVRIFLRKGQLTNDTISDIRVNFDNVVLDGFHDLDGILALLQMYTDHTEEELHKIMKGITKPPYQEVVFRLNAKNKLVLVQSVGPTTEIVDKSTVSTPEPESEPKPEPVNVPKSYTMPGPVKGPVPVTNKIEPPVKNIAPKSKEMKGTRKNKSNSETTSQPSPNVTVSEQYQQIAKKAAEEAIKEGYNESKPDNPRRNPSRSTRGKTPNRYVDGYTLEDL